MKLKPVDKEKKRFYALRLTVIFVSFVDEIKLLLGPLKTFP